MADKADTTKADKTKGKERAGRAEPAPYSSIATHPRASVQVRMAKGWGGTAGFLIAALLSLNADVPFVQSMERALISGIAGYLLAWALSIMVWRQWMLAEQRAAVEAIERRREQLAAEEAAAKQAKAAAAAKAGAAA